MHLAVSISIPDSFFSPISSCHVAYLTLRVPKLGSEDAGASACTQASLRLNQQDQLSSRPYSVSEASSTIKLNANALVYPSNIMIRCRYDGSHVNHLVVASIEHLLTSPSGPYFSDPNNIRQVRCRHS